MRTSTTVPRGSNCLSLEVDCCPQGDWARSGESTQANRIVVTCPDWRILKVSPSPMLTTVAGVFWARADRGGNNKGSTNETLTSRLFKGFLIGFKVDADSIPLFATTITLFALLPKLYALPPPKLMLLPPHRLSLRPGTARQLSSGMKAG